ncbi:MAG: D-alanine--D-alanine ligase, partial [Calditrichaceae bacterium]
MKIVVLMGGDSSEREVSLVSGDQVAKALTENGHEIIKIDPSATKTEQTELNQTDKHWIGIEYPDTATLPLHRGSLYTKNILIIKRLKVDAVFNALHGGNGENGIIQGMLDASEIPYSGSGRIASMIAMEKDLTKFFFESNQLPVPKGIVFTKNSKISDIPESIGYPLIVKPNDQGSTIGLHVVEKQSELRSAIEDAFKFSSKLIIEEFIPGREITVAILGNRYLSIVEIKPKHGLYDYECKYTGGMSSYEAPANIEPELTKYIQEISLKAHQVLGCRGYSRVDLRLTEKGEPYILEVNTNPGMTGTSLVPKSAKAVNISFNNLLEQI